MTTNNNDGQVRNCTTCAHCDLGRAYHSYCNRLQLFCDSALGICGRRTLEFWQPRVATECEEKEAKRASLLDIVGDWAKRNADDVMALVAILAFTIAAFGAVVCLIEAAYRFLSK